MSVIRRDRLVSLARGVLAKADLEVRRRPAHVPAGRATPPGAMRHLAGLGLCPGTVLDVGAGVGTPWLYEGFPDAVHVMLEPLEEFAPALASIATGLPRAELVPAAAGAQDGTVTLNVHKDLVGSSMLLEQEDSDVNGLPRTVRQVRLDTLVEELAVRGPYLLKADTQGSELAVLAGAAQGVLPRTEAVVLEVSLFRFFDGGPQLAEVVATMGGYGFEVHDIIDPQYRPLDGALAQVDMVFLRSGGPYRRDHRYATAGQRRAQDEQLRAALAAAVPPR